MEYMVIYGFAMIIIMIVAVALWQMGIFKTPGPSRGQSGFSQIKPIDWKMSGTSLTVTLTNDAGNKLVIKKDGVTASVNGVGCDKRPDADIELRPGQMTQIELTCSGFSGTVGEYYRAEISIEYYNPVSEITHSSAGKCWGAIE